MGTKRNELGAIAVSQIKRRGINFVGGVAGLGLNVTQTGSRSWVLRYQVAGIRKDMGLGGYPDVPLALAREQARAARLKLSQGIDPLLAARSARRQMIAELGAAVTFSTAAKELIALKEPTCKSAKHIQQWRTTIAKYAEPKLGKLAVKDIDQNDVLEVLEPIWKVTPETASRLRGRIEAILDWAIAKGYRTESNPARWKGLLDKLLPSRGQFARVEHHPALPYTELPAFMHRLSGVSGMGARALEFAILTGCRSGEVRGATWEEVNFEQAMWVVPASRTKTKREHRVPLSEQTLALLRRLKETSFCSYVFASSRSSQSSGAQLSDMTLSAVLRRMKVDAVPHGFRSTFRDWLAEKTDYPNEVAEQALAHVIPSKVEAAYRRGDLFEKRKPLMQDWANYALSSLQKKEQ